jgi:hypothetical protein
MSNESSAIPKKIVWLASYPKSGNTWFRLFLTALLGDDDLNINEMKTDGIFSSRGIFDNITDIESTYLHDEEAKELLPKVFNEVARTWTKERLFVKIHDAYTFGRGGSPIVPTESTLCALYFIRNPLDIAASLANHNASSIDDAIHLLNKKDGSFAKQNNNLNTSNQIRQLLLNWSGHVNSWTGNLPFPIKIIRYEDMLADTLNVFTEAISFTGIDIATEKIRQALAESSFEKLREQEKKSGFKENNRLGNFFFRKGTTDNWLNELTNAQINSILDCHGEIMTKYYYKPK